MTDAFDEGLAALIDGDPGAPPRPDPDLGDLGIDESEPASPWPEAIELTDAPTNDSSADALEQPRPQDNDEIKWRWADEMAASTPEEPEWIFGDYLAPGTKAIIAGLPKAGKTTLVAALIEAIADVAEFLGRPVKGGPVILASEEGDLTLAPKLRSLPQGRVRVLNRDACWPKPTWSELVAAAIAEAARIGAGLIVIDSLAFWAALEGDRENDAGAAQGVMAALDDACRAGLAVLLVHHQRKAPGANHGTGVRGSGAITGAVHVVLEYERGDDEAPPTQRRLVANSRWPMTPNVLVLDYHHADSTWRVVGEAETRGSAAQMGTSERLLIALPVESPGASEAELCELLGLDARKVSKPLRGGLYSEAEIRRTGGGVKGVGSIPVLEVSPRFSPSAGEHWRFKCSPPP